MQYCNIAILRRADSPNTSPGEGISRSLSLVFCLVFAVCCLSWSVINCPRPDQGQTTPAASMSTHDGTATQQAGAKAVAPPAAARRTFVQVLQDPRGRCACDDCALVAFPIPWHTCTVRTYVHVYVLDYVTMVLEYSSMVRCLSPFFSRHSHYHAGRVCPLTLARMRVYLFLLMVAFFPRTRWARVRTAVADACGC